MIGRKARRRFCSIESKKRSVCDIRVEGHFFSHLLFQHTLNKTHALIHVRLTFVNLEKKHLTWQGGGRNLQRVERPKF